MKSPSEKALPYTVLLVVCGIIAGVVVGAVTHLVTPGPSLHMGAVERAPMVSLETPKGSVKVETSKMEEWSKRMEEAGNA